MCERVTINRPLESEIVSFITGYMAGQSMISGPNLNGSFVGSNNVIGPAEINHVSS